MEPFVTAAEAGGARELLSIFAGMRPRMTIAMYFASAPVLAKHGDVVRRFMAARKQSRG